MNNFIIYFNDDMTIDNTETIYTVLYFNSSFSQSKSLYKYANNTLYLVANRNYAISDAPFNFVTAVTKFNIQNQSDEWDRIVFEGKLSAVVSNLQALIVWW